jgi:type IV pilus assembly protein PilA
VRMPKRGEKGFTLIELLIVVAILGVLAAIVIPNVGRFIGRGETEAAETELENVQSAVLAMMTDNSLDTLPSGTFPADTTSATNDMAAFPSTAACTTDKVYDPDGDAYTASDLDGYILYQHDIIADSSNSTALVNYVATRYTKGTYYVDALGTVVQDTTGYE